MTVAITYTGPPPDPADLWPGDCEVEWDTPAGHRMLCWRYAGHEGDHYDTVDGLWWREAEEAQA